MSPHPPDPLTADEIRRVASGGRTAFDIGEWGLGFMTTSLELGCDCLGEIRRMTESEAPPAGYKLVPGACFPPMMDPDSQVMRRAGVIGHTLWVNPVHEEERWPCGEFVVQSERDRGLPVWTAQDRSIEDTDVVLWYVFGVHHVTRPEEWRVMAVDRVSFWLKPSGLFDRNPALDVPPTH